MGLDYQMIGKRIAKRRKKLGLKQHKVEERADIGYGYLSSIERAVSIPSTEVIMRLDGKQLALAKSFLTWLSEQAL